MSDIQGAVIDNVVELTIEIDAPADAVFDYFVVPEKLFRWLGEEGSIDPRPGGEFRVRVSDDDVAVGSYVELDRPKRVVLSWGWQGSELVPPGSSTVEISLAEDEERTTVTLTHRGLPEDQPSMHLEGWRHYGGVLAEQAATVG